MEKLSFKIDNIFYAIVESNNYKNIKENPEYKNYLQPQKEVFKNSLLPKVKNIITETIKNNSLYEFVKIETIKGKYTKNVKNIEVELSYTEIENINIIYKIFQDIRRELSGKLFEYKLHTIY